MCEIISKKRSSPIQVKNIPTCQKSELRDFQSFSINSVHTHTHIYVAVQTRFD